ncbi:MAG: autotransporter outer membrane beta-barrel domain-containing protein [Bradyrhizobium sp.]|uniref:outer membrane protein n=1 Tax=Bradyrhizobium sp. TaxID=376 RepID=UPI0027277A99|nr:autotransporter outer membrane beta-barrel domain-containing protein [Bradyrhizobium sp.]MDO9564177.1 autotransporter outer membrane beta-barrel domain-containing protein [Bradyrhizobium sp.]MDP3691881.1 autotransporter outer membrane beta-barrel domain-containing protein [Bradyrhizobium sp.]
MKKFLLGTVGLVALGMAAPASAADMAARPYTKAPPPVMASIYNWSGFYVGVNGGWGSSQKSWDFVTPAGAFVAAEGSHDATGGTVGGQIGYRWQASQWVFGLEAQGNWADFQGSNVSLAFPAFTNDTRVDAFGLFTGQVGIAFNNALLYVKGGAAVTSDRYRALATGTGIQVANTVDDTRWGAVVGVGLEYGFAPNWSFAVEYDHMFMEDRTYTFINNGNAGAAGTLFGTDRISQDVDIITARINYRWGGPVVARY